MKTRTVTVQPAASTADVEAMPVSKPPEKLSRLRFDSKKFANPFATKAKHRTPFGEAAQEGSLPFHIQHKARDMALSWTVPIESVNFERLLPLCFEGLREKQHPYNFLAKQAVQEMLDCEAAAPRVVPLLPVLLPSLKAALGEGNPELTQTCLRTLSRLSDLTGPALDPHLNQFLTLLNRMLTERKTRQVVEDLLSRFLQNGGPEAPKLIKSKVPTFQSF
eukprot:GGOE01043136.1.p1 GENE.GGOE01043136.1~~GGOE01043136.1.p1  ORF type:complete len:256 (+),score=66.20 GGOE01043136.1:110-769(+)